MPRSKRVSVTVGDQLYRELMRISDEEAVPVAMLAKKAVMQYLKSAPPQKTLSDAWVVGRQKR